MKSTTNHNGEPFIKPYPKLMIDKEYKMVVLFANESEGTCVFAGTSKEVIGEFEDYTSDDWNDYNGTITLEN
jgi:hypothetical protein